MQLVQSLQVVLQGTRIRSQILRRPKLCGIHEDRGGDAVAFLPCRPNQAQVSLVQGAHRGHKSHRQALLTKVVNPLPCLVTVSGENRTGGRNCRRSHQWFSLRGEG